MSLRVLVGLLYLIIIAVFFSFHFNVFWPLLFSLVWLFPPLVNLDLFSLRGIFALYFVREMGQRWENINIVKSLNIFFTGHFLCISVVNIRLSFCVNSIGNAFGISFFTATGRLSV